MQEKIGNSIFAKAVLIFVIASVVFVLSLQLASSRYLQSAFMHIDEATMQNRASQLDQIYTHELEAQNQLLKNWAVWDDMYAYVQKPTKIFYDANMGPSNMVDLISHYIFIFDAKGKLIATSSKDGEAKASKEQLLSSSAFNQEYLLKISQKIDATVSVEKIGSRYIVLAMHPIVKSGKTGEPNGVVVFARWVDNSFIEHISTLFGTKVTLLELKDVAPEFDKNALSMDDVDVKWINKSDQLKQTIIYPESKKSLFVLGFEHERVFYKYGLEFLSNISIFGTIFILLINMLMFWLLRAHILKRLVMISNKMEQMESSDEHLFLPEMKSNDEIGYIVKTANAMLAKKYGYQEQLSAQNRVLAADVQSKLDELRVKDAAILKQAKYVTIGETIANISHQWRQPLNDLWLVLQSLTLKYKNGKLDDAKFDEMMGQSKELISHMSDTIEDFQGFFKPDKEKTIFFVNDMLKKALTIVRPSYLHNEIELKVVEEDRFATYGVANEFAQGVLNILNNAKDALIAKRESGRKVEIELLSVGGMVVLSIADNAGGIEESVLDTIFEPYITTKHGIGGTGIGLYITRQAIEQCDGGDINAENIDEGARFTIILNEHGYESYSV